MIRLLFFLLFSCTVTAQGQTKLKFSRLTNNVYVYTNYKLFAGSQFPSNSMYVVTDEGVVILDTPWDEEQFQPLLDSIQKRHARKVVLCIATHYHADSTAGLEFFAKKGIATYSSRYTYDLCAKHGEKQAQHYFSKDTVFKIGGRRIETFYPGEGHTKDNIVIWLPEEKILYGGCLIKSHESPDLGNIANASLDKWDGTMKKLIDKYPVPAVVVPGHFAWSEGRRALRYTRKLLAKQ